MHKAKTLLHGSIRYRLNLCCIYGAIFVCVVLTANQMKLLPILERGMIKRINSETFKARKQMAVSGATSETTAYETTAHEGKTATVLILNTENEIVFDLSYLEYNLTQKPKNDNQIDRKGVIDTSKETDSAIEGERSTILLWNPLQFPTFPIPEIPLCGGGCTVTRDREKFNKSDAVVFTMKELNLTELPNSQWRRSGQVFVWWSEESAWASKIMYRRRLKKIKKNYFNWTMTYKKDSDVNAMMIPYKAREFVQRRILEYDESQSAPIHKSKEATSANTKSEREIFTLKRQAKKLMRRKGKMAAWVASNCGYTAGAVLRRNIVTKLQFLGLKVDIYGECGDRNVPKTLAEYAKMLSEYKFYLAFENAFHCKDYITEKFWYNSLYSGAVPVIWGPLKSDVEIVAPRNSFIHYENFKNDEELVDYLIRLSVDDNEYFKYFAWWWETPEYFPIYGITESFNEVSGRRALYDFEMNAFCHLCSRLNKGVHKKFKKSIPSLYDWWYKDESKTCLNRTHGAKLKLFRSDTKNDGYQVVVNS